MDKDAQFAALEVQIEPPQGYTQWPWDYTGRVFTEGQMREYARAAITQDRQSRGEPVAWHSKQYGTVWMAIKPGSLVPGTQWFIDGRADPVAEVVSPVSLVWCIPTGALPHGTVFYARPQPAESVKGSSDGVVRVLNLALEYWSDRQQRYKNRAPVWVQEARALLASYEKVGEQREQITPPFGGN